MTPILYSFRRCPYAMRARLAIASAGVKCELREILLRDKASEFLAASPKGTVPVVVDGDVIEESLDVMHWALKQNDPEDWLDMHHIGWDWITRWDGDFKLRLDRTKYANRYPDEATGNSRTLAHAHLQDLEAAMIGPFLFGDKATIADYAMLPFVRQFANIDRSLFDAEPLPKVQAWLNAFLASDRFAQIMPKFPKWEAGDPVTYFP
ncbi:MAG: glutathione S-transferase [Planktomarina sp.]